MPSKIRKKEYDRKNQKRIYAKYKEDRQKIVSLLGNKCCVCDKDRKYLHLHHIKYDEHSNYPRTSNGWSRIRRVKEALLYPEKFRLVCPTCHHIIHKIENFPKEQLLKLYELIPER
jgi:hypothetical protein